jgi:hypothetical protein
MFGLWGRKWQEAGENCIIRSFIICIPCQILLGWSNRPNIMVKQLTLLLHSLEILDLSLSWEADYSHWGFSEFPPAITTFFSLIKIILPYDVTRAVVKALLNSSIIDQCYLLTHTFSGGEDGLLLPYSEVEELLLICMQCEGLRSAACATVHLTAVSSLESLRDRQQTVTVPWRPIGLWDVQAPTFSRQSAHRWRWDCQPHVPATLYPLGRFLVLISVRGWANPGP